MTDLVTLILQAGDGGNGRVSFRREKYVLKGGPDGGSGGDGGDITIVGSRKLTTLKKYAGKVAYSANQGQAGGSRKKYGRKGERTVLSVPIGTEIWVAAENETARQRRMTLGIDSLWKKNDVSKEKYYLEKEGQSPPSLPEQPWLTTLDGETISAPIQTFASTAYHSPQKIKIATITEDGQAVIICQGGFGGRGNVSFKGPENTTPLEAEYGTPGEKRVVILELKLLADIGLVGFPNAGKSTLLSVLTSARPKVANYPFTTLEPHLGIMSAHDADSELIIADIPGLIEGASEGKGLGLDFLRHIENCSALLYVLSLDEAVVFDDSLTAAEKAAQVLSQFTSLQQELAQHSQLLTQKPFLLGINKADLYDQELSTAIKQVFKKQGLETIMFSAATSENIDKLRQKLFRLTRPE